MKIENVILKIENVIYIYIYMYEHLCMYIEGVLGGMCQTSGECSLS
jgi:hypothetical protein